MPAQTGPRYDVRPPPVFQQQSDQVFLQDFLPNSLLVMALTAIHLHTINRQSHKNRLKRFLSHLTYLFHYIYLFCSAFINNSEFLTFLGSRNHSRRRVWIILRFYHQDILINWTNFLITYDQFKFIPVFFIRNWINNLFHFSSFAQSFENPNEGNGNSGSSLPPHSSFSAGSDLRHQQIAQMSGQRPSPQQPTIPRYL